MNFTQEQISSIMDECAKKQNGYTLVMKMMLESIMRAESNEFNQVENDCSNGYIQKSILTHFSEQF